MALYYNIYKGDRIKTSAEVRQKSISFVIVTKYMTNSAELLTRKIKRKKKLRTKEAELDYVM